MATRTAAIVTVGSELVEGLRIDTNTAEIARALGVRGFSVDEAVSVGDSEELLAETLARLCARHSLVITTGGLGPTHDDITREAASRALTRPLVIDPAIKETLASASGFHTDPEAAAQVYRQAEVLEGAEVMPAVTGTAPGQIVPTPAGLLAVLPGPPFEMRPMLVTVCDRYPVEFGAPAELGVVGMSESDVQVAAQRALSAYKEIDLTVLAKPGDVQVLLFDRGAGASALARAAADVETAIGDACYSADGLTLAEVVVRLAVARGIALATAESCTGGMVAAALTDVAGASAAIKGGVVSYANEVKTGLLGVDTATLATHGAVSEQTALAMAEGCRKALGSDVAVSVTGIAGPDGGTDEKPVGLVWFGVSTAEGSHAARRMLRSKSRAAVRARATATALDLLRRELLGR
ncbi:MAG TPA: nicotinamide-nucleotide amidohydrolase family protein [Coriobacteriia bacterium]|nr:nicotinamide-nucleotide amidohydrolase family protein [Coriobacteriia bacterium]